MNIKRPNPQNVAFTDPEQKGRPKVFAKYSKVLGFL
jgi:hypothetical protein